MGRTFDRELERLLRAAGCHIVRQGKGSHTIWYTPLTERTFSVPSGCVLRTTANGVLKAAGLPKAF